MASGGKGGILFRDHSMVASSRSMPLLSVCCYLHLEDEAGPPFSPSFFLQLFPQKNPLHPARPATGGVSATPVYRGRAANLILRGAKLVWSDTVIKRGQARLQVGGESTRFSCEQFPDAPVSNGFQSREEKTLFRFFRVGDEKNYNPAYS